MCGGNHWHVSFPKVYLKEYLFALYRDATMRYFLPWVFTEPDDTDSASNFYLTELCAHPEVINESEVINECGEFRDHYNLLTAGFANGKWHRGQFLVSKENHVCFNTYETKDETAPIKSPSWDRDGSPEYYNAGFEFRGFDSSQSKWILDQQDFVVAYVKWVTGRVANNDYTKVKFMSQKQLQQIGPFAAIAAFNDLLDNIGLDSKRYAKYVQRNLLPRWEDGRIRN